jgi:hypothetical protein
MSSTDLRASTATTAGYGGPDAVGDAMLADLLEALTHSIGTEEYLALRAQGGDHAGILKLHSRRCNTGFIQMGLKAGATCAELNSIGTPWTKLNSYCAVRRTAQDHQAALAAMALDVNGMDYANCIYVGATHQEILEIAALTKSQFDYAICRDVGISHRDLVAAAEQGINCTTMRYASQKGISLAELSAAVERGDSPSMYVELSSRTKQATPPA